MADEAIITIRQVANGWVVTNGWVVAGKAVPDVLHVAITPDGLAKYVAAWALPVAKG